VADQATRPFRVLPAVTTQNEHVWRGGADGELRFLRCRACGYWIHPPTPVCPRCLSQALDIRAVSGRAVVHTFTVNWQPWYPGFDPPYVVAIVELPEQAGLRLTTNIVGCPPEDVAIGMPVRVTFEQYDDVWLPLFEPVAEPREAQGDGATPTGMSGRGP
jgi:uncharacterized OB-fold protein